MTPDVHHAALRLSRLLVAASELAARTGTARVVQGTRIGAALHRRTRDLLFRRLARCLAQSATGEHREVAAALDAAVDAVDYRAAWTLARTAGCKSDLRAEKVISRRHRFVWICVPKVASRSIIAGLRAADPGAEVVRRRTLDEILERRPETRGYFRFAFMRHPVDRALSFYADKHALALRNAQSRCWFIDPWYGLETGMSFVELCRWLDTPWGSDAFADRHWLSQHRQIVSADGRLPDFIGHWETLEADWRSVAQRLGMPWRPLPRLNARPRGAEADTRIDTRMDADSVALLRRRYREDFRLGGYGRA